MVVTAWNNGAHSRNGSGYGFKVHPDDRDSTFKKEWTVIRLQIPGESEPAEVTIDAEKFWSEQSAPLTSKALGGWLRKNGLAPWAFGNPPRFLINPVEDNLFVVEKLDQRGKF